MESLPPSCVRSSKRLQIKRIRATAVERNVLPRNGLKIVTRTVELLPPVCNFSNPGSKLPFMIALGLNPRGGVGHMPSVKLQRFAPSWADKPPCVLEEVSQSKASSSSSASTDDSTEHSPNDSFVSECSNVSSSDLDENNLEVQVEDTSLVHVEKELKTELKYGLNTELNYYGLCGDHYGNDLNDPMLQCYGCCSEDLDPSGDRVSPPFGSISDYILSTPGCTGSGSSSSSEGRASPEHFHHIVLKPGDLDYWDLDQNSDPEESSPADTSKLD